MMRFTFIYISIGVSLVAQSHCLPLAGLPSLPLLRNEDEMGGISGSPDAIESVEYFPLVGSLNDVAPATSGVASKLVKLTAPESTSRRLPLGSPLSGITSMVRRQLTAAQLDSVPAPSSSRGLSNIPAMSAIPELDNTLLMGSIPGFRDLRRHSSKPLLHSLITIIRKRDSSGNDDNATSALNSLPFLGSLPSVDSIPGANALSGLFSKFSSLLKKRHMYDGHGGNNYLGSIPAIGSLSQLGSGSGSSAIPGLGSFSNIPGLGSIMNGKIPVANFGNFI